ncbi:MAG: recombinase family protein, partial [Negativibacillus sp.]
YNKVIWQCVTATKKGKKFCPDSKGIAEETIEQAFIESYRLLCQNNKDVLDEFIARTEETLSDSNASKQLAKVEKDIASLDAKRAKLVDMRLEEIIDKDTYEQKYFDLSSQIEHLQKQRESLQESAEAESTMKKRIAEFRRTLEENEVLDTFDRYVFESIVEKVIVGGYDEDGNKDPSMLTFIYKTGFKNSLDGTNFKPPRKNSKAAKQSAGLCSHTTDEAKSMCSYHSDDTLRMYRSFGEKAKIYEAKIYTTAVVHDFNELR